MPGVHIPEGYGDVVAYWSPEDPPTMACYEACMRYRDPQTGERKLHTERVRLYTRGQIERSMMKLINNPEVVWSRYVWDPKLFDHFMAGLPI